MDDVPAGEFFILMPGDSNLKNYTFMHFFLIRGGSCFSNLSWLQVSVIEKDWERPWRLKNQCFWGSLSSRRKKKRGQ